MITYKHIRNLDSSQTENGAIFTCGGLSVLLIWVRNRVFLFDSHCRNVEGFPDSNGSAIFLKFRLILSPNNLIKRFYHVNVTIHFFSCITCNQNVKINIYAENISNIQTALNRQRNHITTISPKGGIMILVLKLLSMPSLRSVNKMKGIIFDLNKMKFIMRNLHQINQGKSDHLKSMKIS